MFLVTAAVFLPTLWNGFVEWDDPSTILNNPHLRALGGEQLRWMFTTFYWGHYQPLLWLSYALDHAWAAALLKNGLDPAAYHATSLLLHAVATMLVFFLARTLLAACLPNRQAAPSRPSAHGVRYTTLPAVCAALLFGLHPLRVEPAVWVTGRGDVLAAVFVLASVLAYRRAVRTPAAPIRLPWLTAAIVAHALALLCRATAVTLPLLLILLDWYPLRRLGWRREGEPPGEPARQELRPPGAARLVWLEKLPFLVLSAAAAIVAPLAKTAAGSTVELARHGILERIAQACHGIVFYLWKTVLPLGLSPIYELRLPMDPTAPRYVASMLTVLVGTVAVALLARRRPAVPCALAAYLVLLLPVLGLVQSGNQLAADRYSYLPAAALAMLLAGGIRWLLTARRRLATTVTSRDRGRARRLPSRPGRSFALPAGLWSAVRFLPIIAVVAVCAVLSLRQIGVWRNTESLWTHAAAIAPNSSIAQNGYGWVLLQAGRYDDALGRLRRAVELQPANEQAHNNIWIALRRQGREDELPQAYRDSIRVFPNFTDAHYNLGVELQRRGQTEEALAEYRIVLNLRPRHSEALTNLGRLLQQKGEIEEARRYYAQAIEADGGNLIARRNLARLLRSQNRLAEAVAELEAALRVAPDDEITRKLLDEWRSAPP